MKRSNPGLEKKSEDGNVNEQETKKKSRPFTLPSPMLGNRISLIQFLLETDVLKLQTFYKVNCGPIL